MTEPRYEIVARELRLQILRREYAVGDSLPSESMLCAQFGVSRGPVRQALAMLKNEGMVSVSRGKPAVVRSFDATQTLDTFTPFTQWARLTGRTAGSRTVEIARRRVSEPARTALGLTEGDFVVELLRLRLLDGEPTMLERATYTEEVGSLLFDFDTDSGSITDYLTSNGVRFDSMRHVLDAVAADAVDSETLEIDTGAPLLRERRCSWNSAGEAFEYADDRYRPDRVAFSIINSRTIDPRDAMAATGRGLGLTRPRADR
ncbi:GntR family transcriptional regulator [Mycobacterium sp. GA-1841]|uniref:GntR family transcriptional regulator n=1 Tax=Mycobacterium sp. GA-1841 TaxID=1834154 RepID=UPI00096E8569|nr:GntR family transcriptional regulator [Mycobacterium sp. GA-1841]OMC38106.1 GntR family transcriptional regulator [Mycobacterium sp. GA-1841]